MNIEEFREYCLSKNGVTESFPFDESTLVFKVMDKMFALTSLDTAFRFSVKCDPETAISLREEYPCVQPAWHMNKTHWNMVIVDGYVDDETLKGWVDLSYELVVSGLTKKQIEKLLGGSKPAAPKKNKK
ncbi:MAG: MmcQ/YjbR family DNA-binding protein [Bacteroidota bacterium]